MRTSVAPARDDAGTSDHEAAEGRRAARYAERHHLWRVSQLQKFQTCGKVTRNAGVGILVTTGPDGSRRGAAHGLASCSSTWGCPVCSEHIRTARADEVRRAFETWTADRHDHRGDQLPAHGLLMVTLTLRHTRDHRLADLMDALSLSWRRIQQRQAWRRNRDALGVAGFIRSTEVTYGRANGWHPHLHLYLFTDRPVTHNMRDALHDWLTDAWLAETRKFGVEGLDGIAVDVKRVDASANLAELAHYAAKPESLHLEATRGHRKAKSGRFAPLELLAQAASGEVWAVRAWHEFEVATNGRRAIEFSRGLRMRLGLGQEVADETLTEDAEADTADDVEHVATLTQDQWLTICRAGMDYDVLRAAVDGGRAGVFAVLGRAERVRPDWWRREPDPLAA